MEPLVVPPPHPFRGRRFDLFDRPPGAALTDELGLVEVVDRLGDATYANPDHVAT